MCWPLGHEGWANAITPRLIASRHPLTLEESIDGCRLLLLLLESRGYLAHPSSRSLTSPRSEEKEWPREMRKQIEFSKTIVAHRGAVVGDGALVLVVVRGTCRYEGDLPPADRPELIVRKDGGGIRREKIKEGAGGKLERQRRREGTKSK